MDKNPRYKHRRNSFPPFAAIAKSVWLKCEEWRGLSPGARDLYAIIKCGFNGHNNGDIQTHYSQLKGVKGLSSKRTISKMFHELEVAGWIACRERGGLFRKASKYYLTGRFDKMLGPEAGGT